MDVAGTGALVVAVRGASVGGSCCTGRTDGVSAGAESTAFAVVLIEGEARLSLDIARFWGASAIGLTPIDVTRPSDVFRCSRLAEYPTINASATAAIHSKLVRSKRCLGAGLSGTSTKAAGRAMA